MMATLRRAASLIAPLRYRLSMLVCQLPARCCALIAALCTSLAMAQDGAPDAFRARVEAALVARGLGRDAIGIVGNAIEHDYQTPRAAPPLVMELLADPLRAVDAAAIFARSVPSDVVAFAAAAPGDSTASLDSLLERYIGELAAAQAELMAAVGPFDEGEVVLGLMHGFPVALVPAIEHAVDVARLARARALFLDA